MLSNLSCCFKKEATLLGRFLFLPKQLPSHPWVDKDHLQFVCGDLQSAPMSRSATLQQSLCLGQHKEKHLRKMSASSYTSRHSRWFGGPSKRSFPLTPWGPRKLLICGERRNSKFKRACSFGLACAFRRGRALQGFTSSALLHNTIALPIPNAGKSKFFLFLASKICFFEKNTLILHRLSFCERRKLYFCSVKTKIAL